MSIGHLCPNQGKSKCVYSTDPFPCPPFLEIIGLFWLLMVTRPWGNSIINYIFIHSL
jgi:hypothetical protein